MTIRGPHSAIDAGIALITEDRKAQGLVLGMTVRENTTLAHLDAFAPRGFIDRARENETTSKEIEELRSARPAASRSCAIFPAAISRRSCSPKWLIGDADVYLFDEPTRGIDVGAKAEIYALMVELLARGAVS